ncbi:hypothetical protein DB313_06265 (plasmid) [Borrelia turcica IST7]|uniref:DUF3890 domain-containing protein n=1 Tax=Borrelia turcica IST7 TaxID=1104446 RepID=A0A386PNT5_9SPIR|nr:DUF3890 domain-containing protein [Borrelia turcica]AYE37104.1 hypothetical protein DB313_06265 [Borrelia turcica IST7]
MSSDTENAELKDFYKKILALLSIKEAEVAFDSFMAYTELLNIILETHGVELAKLTKSHLFLLLYYFLGCELKKRGIMTEFEFEKIKKEKFNELEIEYNPTPIPTNIGDTANKKNFCGLFDSFLEKLKKQTKTPSCIGVVK